MTGTKVTHVGPATETKSEQSGVQNCDQCTDLYSNGDFKVHSAGGKEFIANSFNIYAPINVNPVGVGGAGKGWGFDKF